MQRYRAPGGITTPANGATADDPGSRISSWIRLIKGQDNEICVTATGAGGNVTKSVVQTLTIR